VAELKPFKDINMTKVDSGEICTLLPTESSNEAKVCCVIASEGGVNP
jgi:hypothetical protein